MARTSIKVQKRKETKKLRNLVRKGYIPCVVYDQTGKSENIMLEKTVAVKLIKTATPSTLVDLIVDTQDSQITLIKEIQRDLRTNTIYHISFMVLDPKKKSTIPISLVITGESSAVKNNLGMLLLVRDNIEVKGLPTDLPGQIPVDISQLKDVGDTLLVSDLPIPKTLELIRKSDKDLTIVTIRPFQKAVEETTEDDDEQELLDGEGAEAGTEEGADQEEDATSDKTQTKDETSGKEESPRKRKPQK